MTLSLQSIEKSLTTHFTEHGQSKATFVLLSVRRHLVDPPGCQGQQVETQVRKWGMTEITDALRQVCGIHRLHTRPQIVT